MRGAILCVMAMIAGCSTVLGIEDLHPPTIHGVVRDPMVDIVSNVSVVLYRDPPEGASDSIRIDAATTDDKGRFELPIRDVLPLDGYLELVDSRLVRTFSHLIEPVVDHANFDVDVVTLTTDGLGMLVSGPGKMQDPTRSVVIAEVVDASGSPLVGATVTATVTPKVGDPPVDVPHICATDPSNGLPCLRGATGDDGKAWLLDVPVDTKLKISAVDADGKPHTAEFSLVAEPSLVFTPVPPGS